MIPLTYDQWLGALAIWREARNCSTEVLTAIWHVIQNRTNDAHKRWPVTIPGVILQHAQFSAFLASDPNSTKFPVPSSGMDWTAWLACQNAVYSVGSDPTLGATNYESILDPSDRPAWADPKYLTTTIGPFRFYRL